MKGDLLQEPEERFFVNLSCAGNATLADAQGQVKILDDDVGGALTIDDVSVAEGHSGTRGAVFTVALGVAAPSPITVRYSGQAGHGLAQRLHPDSGRLVFRVGQVSQTLTVKVRATSMRTTRRSPSA